MERVLLSGPRLPPRAHPRRVLEFVRAARSHVGAVRDHNEDFAFAGAQLIAVADGVGGSVFGEVASEIAIASIAYLDDRIFIKPPATEVEEAIRFANLRLGDAGAHDPQLAGMATTLTVLRLDGDDVVIGQVGDSRAYLLRDGTLRRLTRDDSLVQDLVDSGVITAEQARSHPARSVVLQALGGGPVGPTVEVLPVDPADRYLVCSDGLSDYVDEDVIAGLLGEHRDVGVCCDALVEAALAVGAPDNVTCVVADVGPAA